MIFLPVKFERIVILSVLLACLSLNELCNAQELKPLTPDEFKKELRQTLLKNDEERSLEIIKSNRLLTKPFTNDLITESIINDLQGRTKEATDLKLMAERTAIYFERSFGEKSLTIGVNYLAGWSKKQMQIKLLADSIYQISTQYRIENEKEKALENYESALAKYRDIGDERGEAEVLGGLGALYYNNFEDYSKAVDYYLLALAKREKVDDRQLTGNTLNSLGIVNTKYFRDFPAAISYYEKAEAVRTETGEGSGLWNVRYNKAFAYRLYGDQLNITGNFNEALEILNKAYEIDLSIGADLDVGEVLSLIGFVYSKLGDYSTAAEKQMKAIEIFQKVNDSLALAGAYNNLGIVLQKVGRIEKALDYYNNALGIYEKNDEITEMIPVLGNLGTLFFDMNDYAKAEEYHRKGLNLCRQSNDQEKEIDYLLNLANDQIFLKKLDEALTNYKEGMELAITLNNPDIIWRIRVGMAECYESMGDIEKAVKLNDSALNLIDSLRNSLGNEDLRASLMARERYIFEDIIDFLLTLHEKDNTKGYDLLAYKYAERSKSRVLLDLLTRVEEENKTNRGPEESSGISTEPVSLDEIKSLCPGNTVILQYSVGDSSSCLWIITKSRHALFRLPSRSLLQNQTETIRFALTDPTSDISEFLTQTGESVYNELIKPGAHFLNNKTRLVIIPDGILNYLPFEVLLTDYKSIGKGTPISGYPFLVKKYPVSYVQSASVLKTLILSENRKESPKKTKKLLAFADPPYEDTLFKPENKYPALEFSRGEVERIATFFNKESSLLCVGNKATEESFKQAGDLKKFDYIHFATHGLIDEEKPDQSSLVLTSLKNSKEDGYLTASEIFRLRLDANLAVLSACQTGLGKLVRGEGMIGLTRAFMYAGVPSVVVSLWSVSDISTSYLMRKFYENLIKNKLSKADALQKAKVNLIKEPEYAHPFYWAPFVIIGDWR